MTNLSKCHLSSSSSLDFARMGSFSIAIQSTTGERVFYFVTHQTTIATLMRQIEEKESILISHQILTWGGRDISEKRSRTLRSFNFRQGSTLQLDWIRRDSVFDQLFFQKTNERDLCPPKVRQFLHRMKSHFFIQKPLQK